VKFLPSIKGELFSRHLI